MPGEKVSRDKEMSASVASVMQVVKSSVACGKESLHEQSVPCCNRSRAGPKYGGNESLAIPEEQWSPHTTSKAAHTFGATALTFATRLLRNEALDKADVLDRDVDRLHYGVVRRLDCGDERFQALGRIDGKVGWHVHVWAYCTRRADHCIGGEQRNARHEPQRAVGALGCRHGESRKSGNRRAAGQHSLAAGSRVRRDLEWEFQSGPSRFK